MVQKILINTNSAEYTISRSTYSRVMKQNGWKFIGMYTTKADADAEISRLKSIDTSPIPVTITTQFSGNGTVIPETEGAPVIGGDYTYRFEPASGNRVYSIVIDGVDCGPITTYTFKRLTRNHTLTVVFSPIVSPSEGNTSGSIFATPGGYVSKKGNIQIPLGSSFTFRAQPYPGYQYDKIIFNGVEYDLESIPQGSLLFEDTINPVSGPISIQVHFRPQVLDPLPDPPVLKYIWENLYGVWNCNVPTRNDPDIIAAIEYFIDTNPALINGGGCNLKIVQIPDDVEWVIRKNCAGNEVVASQFEVWS
jgi:hypothetical protein